MAIEQYVHDHTRPRAPAFSELREVPRLRSGSALAAANTLWSGEVVAPSTSAARAIEAFNDRMNADLRVEDVRSSVRDDLMLARKL